MARRLVASLLLSLSLAVGLGAAEPVAKPDLVVVISIDQMRADYLPRFAPWFSKGGFARLLAEGAYFPDAALRHSITATGPGHATIGSGLDPRDHGIAGNDWFDRIADDEVYCVHDPHVVPTADSNELASPWRLDARGLGDAVRQHYPDAKVIGVAGKDRASVLMAGRRADAAYWFDEKPGVFMSSSYYRWNPEVLKFNETLGSLLDRFDTWELSGIIPPDDLARVTFDPAPLRRHKTDDEGLGTSFPHPVSNRDAFLSTPHFDTLLFEFAMHVIETEKMGTRPGVPDVLFLGPSAVDYYGHNFGPDSMEIADGIVRLDRDIERFLAFLDRELAGRWLVALTSDHGVQQIPEIAAAQGKNAGRFRYPGPRAGAKTMNDLEPQRLALEKALAEKLGIELTDDDPIDQALIRWVGASGFYLDWSRVAAHGIDPERARRALKECVLRLDGLQAAWTASELLAATPPKNDLELIVRRSFRPDRSPDVVVVLEPGWLFTGRETGTTHGQPVEDDMRVPLVLAGVGVRSGTCPGPASPVDMIRTLGRMLGVTAGARDAKVLGCGE